MLSLNVFAQPLKCETDNADLQAMAPLMVEFVRADGSVFQLESKLADNNQTRAAGFQHVCQSTIEASPILFKFQSELIPQFHMNNVVAPLDVAFIDKNGRIESIQLMKPYSLIAIDKPLYRPSRPIVAVFEAHKGFFKKHNLDIESTVAWHEAANKPLESPKEVDAK